MRDVGSMPIVARFGRQNLNGLVADDFNYTDADGWWYSKSFATSMMTTPVLDHLPS